MGFASIDADDLDSLLTHGSISSNMQENYNKISIISQITQRTLSLIFLIVKQINSIASVGSPSSLADSKLISIQLFVLVFLTKLSNKSIKENSNNYVILN